MSHGPWLMDHDKSSWLLLQYLKSFTIIYPQQHLIWWLFLFPRLFWHWPILYHLKSFLYSNFLFEIFSQKPPNLYHQISFLYSSFLFEIFSQKPPFRQMWLTLFLNICCELRRYFLSVSLGLTKNLHCRTLEDRIVSQSIIV